MTEFGFALAKKGHDGINSFIVHNKWSLWFMEHGEGIVEIAKIFSPVVLLCKIGYDMLMGLTFGESVAKNGGSALMGAFGAFVATTAGLGLLGVIGVGLLFSGWFDLGYKQNEKFRDSINYVGHIIDKYSPPGGEANYFLSGPLKMPNYNYWRSIEKVNNNFENKPKIPNYYWK